MHDAKTTKSALVSACRSRHVQRKALCSTKALHPAVLHHVRLYDTLHDHAVVLKVGADLSMGSLIKNPGGTIVTGGGYVAGKAHLVAAAQARLTAPGVGLDAGSVPGDTVRLMMQGALLHMLWQATAPHPSLKCSLRHCPPHDAGYHT